MRMIRASEAKDVFQMETSTKEIDKACKLLNEAALILRKWEAALEARKLKSKVDGETGVEIEGLIDTIGKVTEKVTKYAVRISVLKED